MEVEKKSRFLEENILTIDSQMKESGANIPELTKKKLGILLEMKQYESVLNVGFCFIGSQGPDHHVFKHIVAALCYSGKCHESLDILQRWAKIYPDQKINMQEIQQIVEPLVKRVVSGASSSIFQNIDHLLGLKKLKLGAQNGVSENTVWRFRPPPPQCVTHYLCPRIAEIAPCLFGDNCLAAHSKEELQEWKARAKSASLRTNGMKPVVLGISPTPPQAPVQVGETRGPRFTAHFSRIPEPPPNTPYLNQLIDTYSQHPEVFCTFVEGVKLTWSSPLQFRTTNQDHVWIVLIRSERKDTLRTVSLLHNTHRGHFRISEAYFCEDSSYRQCMDLIESNICNHKNASKLQVLSTFIPPKCLNRPCYYYRIGFIFRGTLPGDFSQTIVFDFKENPKLIQHLIVQVLKNEATLPNGPVGLSSTPAIAQIKTQNNTQRLMDSGHSTSSSGKTQEALKGSQAAQLKVAGPTIPQHNSTTNHLPVFKVATKAPNFGNSPTYDIPTVFPGTFLSGRNKLPGRKYAHVPQIGESYKEVPLLHTVYQSEPLHQAAANGHGPILSGVAPSCISETSSSESDSPVSFEETLDRPIPPPISRPKPKPHASASSATLGKTFPLNPTASIRHPLLNCQGSGFVEFNRSPPGLNPNRITYQIPDGRMFPNDSISDLTYNFGNAYQKHSENLTKNSHSSSFDGNVSQESVAENKVGQQKNSDSETWKSALQYSTLNRCSQTQSTFLTQKNFLPPPSHYFYGAVESGIPGDSFGNDVSRSGNQQRQNTMRHAGNCCGCASTSLFGPPEPKGINVESAESFLTCDLAVARRRLFGP